MMSIVGFLPAYMTGVMGTGTLLAGTALGAMSVAWPVGGFVGSRILLRTSYRRAATIGGVILIAGSLLLIALHIDGSIAQPIIAALLAGFGMGITNICFVVAIQADVNWSQRGAATSSVTFSRIMGQSFGSAVFGGILNFGLSGGRSAAIISMLCSGDGRDADAGDVQAVIGALTASLHNIYLLSGLLALVVLTTALLLPSELRLADDR